MLMSFSFVSLIMFFSGFTAFCLKRKHLLLMLLSLEFVVLSLYMVISSYMFMFLFENYFLMVFLTLSVCEGALGLSILVSLIRSHGNDYFSSFNVLW